MIAYKIIQPHTKNTQFSSYIDEIDKMRIILRINTKVVEDPEIPNFEKSGQKEAEF